MRKSGLILSVMLAAVLLLGAAAREVPDAAQRVSPDAGSASLEKSRALAAIARTLDKVGDAGEAVADYTAAIDGRSLPREEQARALFDRGLLLDEMNRLQAALGDYSAALALSPGFAEALNNRANVYRRLNRLDDASRDYLASLAAGNPQSQYPYYGLGQLAEARGDQSHARAFYEKALAADPGFALAGRHLAALDEAPIHLHPPSQGRRTASAKELPRSVVLGRPWPAAVQRHGNAAKPELAAYHRAVPELKPSLAGGGPDGGQVQLGAWRSQREAEAGWSRTVERAEGALQDLSPRIVAVDLPQGRFYRVRVVPDKVSPQAFCAALTRKGLDCIPARD